MKNLLILTCLLLICSCKQETLTLIAEEDLIDRIVNDKMPSPEKVQLLNAEGNRISLDSLISLESTDNYFEDFYVNSKNEIVKIVIRPKTPKDEAILKEINERLGNESDQSHHHNHYH